MRSTHSYVLAGIALVAIACGGPPTATDAGAAAVETDGGVNPDIADAGSVPPAKDAGTPDAGFDAVPVHQWCEHLALARCHQKARCLSLDVSQPSQVAACLEREKLACDQAAFTNGVQNGRLQYLASEAAHCINAYGSGSCTATPDACTPVFQGLVPGGGGCVLPQECQSGSYCLTSQNTCPHTCYTYRGVGDDCNSSDQQCDPQTAYCDYETQKCTARRNAGESCKYWSDCHALHGCVDQVCVRLTAALGEPCRIAYGYPSCDDETFCRQEGVAGSPGECVRRVGLGGVCTGYGTCLPGLRCSSSYAIGTCIPLGAVYDVCSFNVECQAELYCSPASSQCLPLPRDGGDCSSRGSGYTCAPGYYCDYSDVTCRPRRDIAERCSYDGACQSNSCDYGTLADGGSGFVCTESCSARLDGGT